MAKAPFKNKTALILGADCPAGRSVALKFSRVGAKVIIAGFDKESLDLLSELILDKHGEPAQAVLPHKGGDTMGILREKQKASGHIHAIVNAVAVSSYQGEERKEMICHARALNEVCLDLVKGTGVVRVCTIWPDDAGEPPKVPAPFWHTLVTLDHIEGVAKGEGEGLKAAAVADTVLTLMSCEGGACPVEARLEARRTKV